MATVANGSPFAGYWIGLHKEVGSSSYSNVETTIEPGWTPKCTGCYARFDEAGPPDPDAGRCLTASKIADAAWSAAMCASKVQGKATLCEQEPPGHRTTPCLGNNVCFSVAATLGGPPRTKRYVFVPSVLAYADAAKACASLGASIVVFDSREEREQVAAEVARMADDFWVDLVKAGGTWGWDSGLDPSAVWAAGEPVSGNGTYAYVAMEPGRFDSELAHAANDAEPHYVVCQL
jgi:hypothetical protein